MQYVGRAIGSVSKTWSSINPATLSGAIDVIVVEHPDATLACSPFHVRFGKFQILKPSQKKVEVIVNGKSTNIPMKLGDSGEAYFVFETSSDARGIPNELLSSPVISATSSPPQSPQSSSSDIDNNNIHEPNGERSESSNDSSEKKIPLEEPDFLDINDYGANADHQNPTYSGSSSPTPVSRTKIFQQKLNKKLTQIHIPSKLENNGDLLLDIEGYKPNKDKMHNTDNQLKQLLQDELGSDFDISSFIKEDMNGNIRIVNPYEHNAFSTAPGSPPVSANESLMNIDSRSDTGDSTLSGFTSTTDSDSQTASKAGTDTTDGQHYIKTLRLSSEQLKCLDLKYGENDLTFSVDQGKAIVTAKLFVWRWDVPIVISDIDGTITKSDALGHVMTMIGKDWTHVGVAKLFTEIYRNGYNVMYLTARSAGLADSTRGYLRTILQNGNRLPVGPVILSPDRTMAALRREVILKKPEVFKIACLNDIRSLYFEQNRRTESNDEKDEDSEEEGEDPDERPTPFFAGFGNRITDALSYRTVGIPSSRIFTINPDGEVHMELLELAGYRSSYVFINELVDHFFPPVSNDDEMRSVTSMTPGSPVNNSMDMDTNADSKIFLRNNQEKKFTDANFWREPILDIDDLSDISHSDDEGAGETRKNHDSQHAEQREDSLKDNENENFSKSVKGNNRGNTEGASLFVRHGSTDGDAYGRNFSTPQKKRRPSTKEELGKQIYLELGSPLSSPKMNYIDTKDINNSLKRMSISKPSRAVSEVSKVNVLDGVHSAPKVDKQQDEAEEQDDDGGDDGLDDEFDEDEFVN